LNPSFGGKRARSSSKSVAIVGGGPAGLSCAYFLTGMGHRVTLFEKMSLLGGMLRVGIPAYRLPREVLNHEIQCVLDRGVNVVAPALVGKDVKWETLRSFDAVFIAMGNHRGLKLHIPGEEAEGIFRSRFSPDHQWARQFRGKKS
jgi:NADPH-dependent glutamate synthase beta subunit-like oxidoreductase